MQNSRVVGINIILLVILASCSTSASPTPALQSMHTQPQTSPPSVTLTAVTSPAWVARLTAAVNTAPLLSGNLVIVPTADGVIHAVRAETGEIAWVYSGGSKVWDASVNADEARVCAGAEGKQVFCLDAKTGSLLWTVTLELEVQSRIALTSNRLFAPTTHAGSSLENDFSGQAVLVALDASNGQIIWQAPTENYILRRPVVNDNIVITGGAYQLPDKSPGEIATRVYAFNLEDGSLLWKYESNDGLLRWVESSGDVVTFSAATEIVYALGLKDGQLLWQSNPGYWMQFPVMQDGRIFFGSGDEIFRALHASTGREAWLRKINIASLNQIGRPVIRDNAIWFNSVTGEIYALDINSGERLAYINTGRSSRVGGTMNDAYYFMGDPDGSLYAYAIQ
ncbi:MAG: PQQ-binding-like beta-propeller repeat protein [Chloroflexota bacterium]